MLAQNLLLRIENNWEKIASQVIAEQRRDPLLAHYQTLSEAELRERVRDLATNLGAWLNERDESRLIAHYEKLGRRRFREGIPLHEVIHKITLIKRVIREFATEQNLALTPIEIYAELDLLRTMAAFFDFVIYRVARGYEQALREEMTAEAQLPVKLRGSSPALRALIS